MDDSLFKKRSETETICFADEAAVVIVPKYLEKVTQKTNQAVETIRWLLQPSAKLLEAVTFPHSLTSLTGYSDRHKPRIRRTPSNSEQERRKFEKCPIKDHKERR